MSGRGFGEIGGGFGGEFGGEAGPLGFRDAEARRQRLREIQDVAGELRRPVSAPDLTAAILARVEEERPFVSPRTRRLVWISRMAFAASLGVAALGIALLHRSAPELVAFRSQARPVSDVVQVAKTEATAGYRSIRTTLSSVGGLAAAGDRAIGARFETGHGESADVNAAGVRGAGLAAADVRLAPLPPSHGATFVSLSLPRASGVAETIDAGMSAGMGAPVVVSTVRLAPGLAPRPLVSDAQPSAVYWGSAGGSVAGSAGGGLSTAPVGSMSVPMILLPSEFRVPGEPRGLGTSGGAEAHRGGAFAVERRVLDSLMPAGAAIGSGETAVPR